VNSEELEVSLRTEFESYLKNVFAEMRQEISQLHETIEAEFESHKSRLDGVFKEALSRADQEREFDPGFKDSVVEHMRLARDEGARITATAIGEAEELQKQNAPKVGIKELHLAVNEISSKSSQAEILKTLVTHGGQFTPRGAFFIIKNEHFVGWRTFGGEKGDSDEAVRDIFLPVTSESILSEAYRSLVTVESGAGTYADDEAILGKLGYEGSPAQMFAIPLVVRGRAVAVLYADYGTQGGEVNVEALETLVRVAGLTVEVLASAKGVSARESRKKPAKAFAGEGFAPAIEPEPKDAAQPEFAAVPNFNAPVSNGDTSYQSSFDSENYAQPSFREEPAEQKYPAFDSYQPEKIQAEEPPAAYQPEEVSAPTAERYEPYEEQTWNEVPVEAVTEINAEDYSSVNDYAPNFSQEEEAKSEEVSTGFAFQPSPQSEPEAQPESDFSAAPVNEYQFDSNQQFEAPKVENFDSFSSAPSAEVSAPVDEESFSSFEAQPSAPVETSFVQPPVETSAQPVQQASVPPVKSRFSERNVDLPIEVSEDERRLHNDARRFARLLVSEIKLYNEQKVKEGRDTNDLYDRLREAIDRSREMYDKRVQSPVAAKFDYFHYELVNTLAEGEESKLGSDYPGATV
jgi:hypothetical protein